MRPIIATICSLLLSSITCGDESVSANGETCAAAVETYRQSLEGLPKDNAASIANAVGNYLIDIAPLAVAERTEAFLYFLDFHDEVCKRPCRKRYVVLLSDQDF